MVFFSAQSKNEDTSVCAADLLYLYIDCVYCVCDRFRAYISATELAHIHNISNIYTRTPAFAAISSANGGVRNNIASAIILAAYNISSVK